MTQEIAPVKGVLRPDSPVKTLPNFRGLMREWGPDFEKALHGIIPMEAMIAAAINSVRKNPKLLECTSISMISALMYCAQMQVLPDTPEQHAHLVPFKTKGQMTVVFITGFRGLQYLARRSGTLTRIEAQIVREGDEFHYERGLYKKLIHIPLDNGAANRPATHYYSILAGPDFEADFEVMTREEVDRIRMASPGRAQDPWTKHFDEMARKTVSKRHFKWSGVGSQLASAVDLDNKAEAGEQPIEGHVQATFGELTDQPVKSKTDALAEKMGVEAPEPAQKDTAPTMTAEIVVAEMKLRAIPDDILNKYPAGRLGNYNQEALINVCEEISKYPFLDASSENKPEAGAGGEAQGQEGKQTSMV